MLKPYLYKLSYQRLTYQAIKKPVMNPIFRYLRFFTGLTVCFFSLSCNNGKSSHGKVAHIPKVRPQLIIKTSSADTVTDCLKFITSPSLRRYLLGADCISTFPYLVTERETSDEKGAEINLREPDSLDKQWVTATLRQDSLTVIKPTIDQDQNSIDDGQSLNHLLRYNALLRAEAIISANHEFCLVTINCAHYMLLMCSFSNDGKLIDVIIANYHTNSNGTGVSDTRTTTVNKNLILDIKETHNYMGSADNYTLFKARWKVTTQGRFAKIKQTRLYGEDFVPEDAQ